MKTYPEELNMIQDHLLMRRFLEGTHESLVRLDL